MSVIHNHHKIMETTKATRTFTDYQLHRALQMSVSKEKNEDDWGWLHPDPFVQREHVTGTDGHHAVNIPVSFFPADPGFKASNKPGIEELFGELPMS